MLYSEFLEATGAPENVFSYCQYRIIEKVYMNDLVATKEEAYKLYDGMHPLYREIIDHATEYYDQAARIEKLTEELEKEKRIRRSLQDTINQAAQEAHRLYYTLTD